MAALGFVPPQVVLFFFLTDSLFFLRLSLRLAPFQREKRTKLYFPPKFSSFVPFRPMGLFPAWNPQSAARAPHWPVNEAEERPRQSCAFCFHSFLFLFGFARPFNFSNIARLSGVVHTEGQPPRDYLCFLLIPRRGHVEGGQPRLPPSQSA